MMGNEQMNLPVCPECGEPLEVITSNLRNPIDDKLDRVITVTCSRIGCGFTKTKLFPDDPRGVQPATGRQQRPL